MKTIAAFTAGISLTIIIIACFGFSASSSNPGISQYKIIETENRI